MKTFKIYKYSILFISLLIEYADAHYDSTVGNVAFWVEESHPLSCWECFYNGGKICHDN